MFGKNVIVAQMTPTRQREHQGGSFGSSWRKSYKSSFTRDNAQDEAGIENEWRINAFPFVAYFANVAFGHSCFIRFRYVKKKYSKPDY